MERILPPCVHDAGRSQMAAAFFNLLADHWPLDDPKGQSPDRVRTIRDEVRARVETLPADRGWGRP